MGTVGGVTTIYIGNSFEWSNNAYTRYYYSGSLRVALRKGTAGGTLSFLLADHLGSTTITANSSGALAAELRYKGWGENRLTSGTTPTTYRFTGQREESSLGIYYYGARWYDGSLSRFISADTIVPGAGSQSWDRYAYVMNNPIRF